MEVNIQALLSKDIPVVKTIPEIKTNHSVNISYEPSPIDSRFSRKQVQVYIIPTIDECMGLLPRHLGNYILSYLNAFLDFYVENLIKKFGKKFVIDLFLKYVFKTITFKNISIMNNDEKIKRFIKTFYKYNYKKEKMIKALQDKFDDLNKKKQIKIDRLELLSSMIRVGDLVFVKYNWETKVYIYEVIKKTPKRYTLRDDKGKIKYNFDFLEYNVLIDLGQDIIVRNSLLQP